MSKQKAKGTREENRLRDKLNEISGVDAKRVVGSGMFAQGDANSDLYGDVRAATRVGELVFESKVRASSGWKVLDKWLGDQDVLVMRADRDPEARVFMRWSTLETLLSGEQKDSIDIESIDAEVLKSLIVKGLRGV